MKIEKTASEKNYARELYYFDQAREGFKYILDEISQKDDGIVLLPSFIGWSSREGSGVFDPVRQSSMNYGFYRLDENLHIDMEDLERSFRENSVAVFVIIHYYGHVDPNYEEIIKIASENGCFILEDEAHALYSDVIDGKCGRKGDAVIFSIHKMLPERSGGALIINNSSKITKPDNRSAIPIIFNYDLNEIAKIRKNNAQFLYDAIHNIDGIRPLWKYALNDETLQTFPVIIENADRNVLYEIMNNNGYGVVSLYHTLIPEISESEFPVSHELSQRIMNLPIHQDADINMLKGMCLALEEALAKQNRK